ncbi:MAG: pilus assembly protein CpaF [Actinomycetota bacterium]|jgi:pilus assembly protein CpaF|nr:pilus assembly protein CpaF [Actinomycetota bacterium]
MTDLLDLAYEHDELAELDPAARRLALRTLLAAEGVDDVAGTVARIADELDGFGPISELMRDDSATDILINGPDEVWVEVAGELAQSSCRFDSVDHLTRWCERFVSLSGGHIDASTPVADVRLSDGARLHVVLRPVAPAGPLVSIRRFPATSLTLADLVSMGSMTESQGAVLTRAVADGRSIVVSGATGSGKTTLLNALLLLVPAGERVVVIEELPELRTEIPNRVSLVARPANAAGKGRVSVEELVRASLRMRPDRIIVGEVRGAEALPALWAATTGHSGSMLTIHASSATHASRRLVDLALMAPRAPQQATLERSVADAVDLFVHVARRDGARMVTEMVPGP